MNIQLPDHSIRCVDDAEHGPHDWTTDGGTWVWCMGTDPIAAVAAVNQRTIDGEPILHGMPVVDYNLDRTHVIGVQSISHGTVWFTTTTGMFDGQRMWSSKSSMWQHSKARKR